MKDIRILCYGDSNTHGFIAGTHGRYDKDTRWTGLLAKYLGDEYTVIEEGLNGRTAGRDNAEETWRNGYDYLKPCILSQLPIDCLVIMLGTNDCKSYMHQTAEMITDSIEALIDVAQGAFDEMAISPKIILMAPASIGENVVNSEWKGECDLESVAKSQELPKLYEALAQKKGVPIPQCRCNLRSIVCRLGASNRGRP